MGDKVASPPFQFQLSSLLLVMTLFAVVMSASVTLPWAGIGLAVLAVPALTRTYVEMRRLPEDSDPVSLAEKALLS